MKAAIHELEYIITRDKNLLRIAKKDLANPLLSHLQINERHEEILKRESKIKELELAIKHLYNVLNL